ncbi:hypothetical protein C8Q72DRAFT_779596 [Fomitopsis betulina]|nr:hypothetical protein C8Q72DRAFT_779596 [Fomitopsis betulina]
MSANTELASGHGPRDNAPSGAALQEAGLTSTDRPLICIDLDDVLSQSNRVVAEWHNDAYGTHMTLQDFHYYYYWRNPYWGTPDDTFRKVDEFYATPRLYEAPPIEGALAGVKALKELGYRLVLVTARQVRELPRTKEWVDKYYTGIFDDIVCTGMSQETLADETLLVTKLSKADVCKKLGAKLMIDDSLENALKCIQADPPVTILLFGDYEWNKRSGTYKHINDEVSFEERTKREGGREWWHDDDAIIPEGAPLTRVNNWAEVVEWVQKNLTPQRD